MNGKPKVIFVVTEDWAFLTHRLPMARAARDMGCEVVVAARDNGVGAVRKIEEEGFHFKSIRMNRRRTNPIAELGTVWALIRLFRRERPDIIHNVALKPILDGTLAARFAPRCQVINTFAGMGSIFIGEDRRGLRSFLIRAFRWLMNPVNVHVIVQNEDDEGLLLGLGVARKERITLIRGSGVDTEKHPQIKEVGGTPVAVMVSRLLWDKGVAEFVEAARLLKRRNIDVRMTLIGDPDPSNPRSVPENQVRLWHQDGIIEWQGHRNDIVDVWSQSHIAVLPSYREGTPKSLLEAAASGRAIVTTDVPGCRQLVDDGMTGLLVPARNAGALADAVASLATDPKTRKKFGEAARRKVIEEFSSRVVAAETQKLYKKTLKLM